MVNIQWSGHSLSFPWRQRQNNTADVCPGEQMDNSSSQFGEDEDQGIHDSSSLCSPLGKDSAPRAALSPLELFRTYRSTTMRDYSVLLEYQRLKEESPRGVFLLPSLDNMRTFHGCVFVRAGYYAGGIFKFTVQLSPRYNEIGAHPVVHFGKYLFHPFIDLKDGTLNITQQFPEWHPEHHNLTSLLVCLKNSLYLRDFSSPAKQSVVVNESAFKLWTDDEEAFCQRALACVKSSRRELYIQDENSSLKFSKPIEAHERIRSRLKKQFEDS